MDIKVRRALIAMPVDTLQKPTDNLMSRNSIAGVVAYKRDVQGKQYLELAVYPNCPEEEKAYQLKYRFFFDGPEWVRYDATRGTYSKTVTLHSSIFSPYYGSKLFWVGGDLAYQFFHIDEDRDLLNAIDEIQNRQVKEAKQKRDAARNEIRDRVLQQFEEKRFTKDEQDWARKAILEDDVYLFFRNERVRDPLSGETTRVTIGYCTGCRKEMELINPVHKSQGRCPCCNRKVTFRNEKLSRKNLTHWLNIGIAEKIGKNLAIRLFHASISYANDFRVLPVTFKEYARVLFEPDGPKYLIKEFSYFGYPREYDMWHYLAQRSTFFNFGFLLYKNFYSVIKGAFLERSPVKQFMDDLGYPKIKRWLADRVFDMGSDVVKFIESLIKYPVTEYLYKLGFRDLIKEQIDKNIFGSRDCGINVRGKNSKAVLGVDLGILRQYNIPSLNQCKIRCIKYFLQNHCKPDTAAFDIFNYENDIKTFDEMAKLSNVSKMMRYFCSQQKTGQSIKNVFYNYRDYIGQCKQLSINISDTRNLFPADLTEAHERLTERIEYLKNKEKDKKFISKVKRFERFSYSDGSLVIRPARFPNELIEEGKELSHCVGGYVSSVAEGYSIIFFVRRAEEPDKPYYTLEIEPKSRREKQLHGYKNDALTPIPQDVLDFVRKWENDYLIPGKSVPEKRVLMDAV